MYLGRGVTAAQPRDRQYRSRHLFLVRRGEGRENTVVRILVSKVRGQGGGSNGRLRQGVLVAFPTVQHPMVVLAEKGGVFMITSRILRILGDSSTLGFFAETRNSVYRVVCAPGDELAWRKLGAAVSSNDLPVGDEHEPTRDTDGRSFQAGTPDAVSLAPESKK
jgi:hypothetical protein